MQDEVVRLQKIIAQKDAEILMLRTELKRMQQVARRASGGKGFTIGQFDKITDKDAKIEAMQAEINRLTGQFGYGSAFKGEYKSKYYSGSARKKEAAKANLAEWQRLVNTYGKDKAKQIAERKRNFKKTFNNKSSDVPKTGNAAHDRFTAIMDSLDESDRELIRDYYDSEDVLDVGTQWLDNDISEDEYVDADVAKEMLDAYVRWMTPD